MLQELKRQKWIDKAVKENAKVMAEHRWANSSRSTDDWEVRARKRKEDEREVHRLLGLDKEKPGKVEISMDEECDPRTGTAEAPDRCDKCKKETRGLTYDMSNIPRFQDIADDTKEQMSQGRYSDRDIERGIQNAWKDRLTWLREKRRGENLCVCNETEKIEKTCGVIENLRKPGG